MRPRCLLVENYCILVENFTFRPVSYVTIGNLAFFFSGGLVRTFLSSSPRRFHRHLDFSPWPNLSWVVPTLRTEFVADVTIGLRDSRKLVVMFCLHRFCDLPFYDLHRSTSLLTFADVKVGLLFYIILQ